MTPVSGVIFSISIALGVHLTTFYTNLSRIFAAGTRCAWYGLTGPLDAEQSPPGPGT